MGKNTLQRFRPIRFLDYDNHVGDLFGIQGMVINY